MDLFPDFDELGIWGYLGPALLLIAVFVPVWRWIGRRSNLSIWTKFLKSMLMSGLALLVIAFLLFLVGLIVFKMSNPSLL